MKCQKKTKLIQQYRSNLFPNSLLVLFLFRIFAELHKKRMDLEQAHHQQIKAQKEAQMEQERQGQILEDVLREVQIMSEEEMAKEAQRIREQNRK